MPSMVHRNDAHDGPKAEFNVNVIIAMPNADAIANAWEREALQAIRHHDEPDTVMHKHQGAAR